MFKKIIFNILLFLFFSFFGYKIIEAEETNIIKYPECREIVYGEPLFNSLLQDGEANVDGVFSFENELIVLNAGTYYVKVNFIPEDINYNNVSFDVKVIVNPKKITIEFEKDLFKQYDGENKISLPNYVLKGIIDNSTYVSGKLEGLLESSLVGENINVSLSGLVLVGEKKDNYYVDYEGYTATVFPSYIEKYGSIKNRIDFEKKTLVPVNSSLNIEETTLKRKGFQTIKAYDVKIMDGINEIKINDKVLLKLNVDGIFNKNKKLNIFNYYNETYEKLNYSYSDGYIVVGCNGVGTILIAKEMPTYKYVYWILFVILVFIVTFVGIKVSFYKKVHRVNKYKGIRRRKYYED